MIANSFASVGRNVIKILREREIQEKLNGLKAFRRAHGKDMTVDTTLEFEKKRNRPLKYDRELIGTTIKAMKRISEIKHNREARYIEQRLKGKKKERTLQAIEEIRRFKEIINPPTAIKPTKLKLQVDQRVKRMQEERAAKKLENNLDNHIPSPVKKKG